MKKLVFIYNAKGGLINGALDFAHKTFSPNTYQCDLCAITYGNTGMKKKWRDFLKELPFDKTFLHKNELDAKYSDVDLPAILLENSENYDILISSKDFKKIKSLEDLISLLSTKIKNEHKSNSRNTKLL